MNRHWSVTPVWLILTPDRAELPRLFVLDLEPGRLDDLGEGHLSGAVALVGGGARRLRERRYQTQHWNQNLSVSCFKPQKYEYSIKPLQAQDPRVLSLLTVYILAVY